MDPRTSNLLGRRAGFTLVELLVVAVIIALLAAIAVSRISGNDEKAKQAEARTTLGMIRRAYLQARDADPGFEARTGGNYFGLSHCNRIEIWKQELGIEFPPCDASTLWYYGIFMGTSGGVNYRYFLATANPSRPGAGKGMIRLTEDGEWQDSGVGDYQTQGKYYLPSQ
ncbi:MAG: type II secretion system protein [Candidatus Omnitrophota bacterium]